MPQFHFYVSEDVAERIRQEANASDLSVSRYLAELIKHEVSPDWPEGFFEDVVGGWQGELLKRPPQGDYEKRDDLRSHSS